MNTIKFSKEYNKLHGQVSAELLAVKRIKIDTNLDSDLLDYDTTAIDGSRYNLRNGKYIQLIFLGNKGIPFCTIRSDKPALNGQKAKYDYYSEKVGTQFEIVRTEASE